IILSLTIVITAFSSCTKEKKPVKETSTKPAPVETTTEKVVDSSTKRQMILISGIMDELLKSKYDNISFCITDLNQNGLLELLVTSYDIDSMKSDTAIYEVDEDFQSMITFSQSEDCEPDYVLFEGICYYDAVEDGYKYLNYDVSLKDNQRITDVYSVILIDGKIETTLIGSEIETMDDSGTTVFKDSKGEELSEDDYSELFTEQFGKAAEYYAQTGWKTYKKEEIGDFINEDPSEIYKVLEDSYKQFILEK
nr:hypothetical protein [Clostridiales bacterium]